MAAEAMAQKKVKSITRGGLNHRHVHFIALGSAIGTGLFYGSADAIQKAGPAVLLVYLFAGVLVYLILRALGEMVVRNPAIGSFAQYAKTYMGGWAGYITGWMFAFEMVIVCLADLTAIGTYMAFWFPAVQQWVWVVASLLIIGAVNLVTVKAFGELEFAFTIVKVGAVAAMIIGGIAIVVFGITNSSVQPGVQNLVADGGFFPKGPEGLITSFILVLFAFGGAEIIGIAGAEADNPQAATKKAVNTVPTRILIFYVLAILVILMISPWSAIDGERSPFVQIFESLGINWAAGLLNFVVVTAALSAINADLYGAGRVLAGLAKEKMAPQFMAKTVRGVPVMTTVVLLVVLVVGVVLNAKYPDAFKVIAELATFATVYVWLMILLAQVFSRRGMSKAQVQNLSYRVPFGLVGQYLAIAFTAATFLIMVWMKEFHTALIVGVSFIAIMSVIYFLSKFAAGKMKL